MGKILYPLNTVLIVALTISTFVLVIQTFLYRKDLSIRDYLRTTIFVAMWGINLLAFSLRISF